MMTSKNTEVLYILKYVEVLVSQYKIISFVVKVSDFLLFLNFKFFSSQIFIFIQFDLDLLVGNIDFFALYPFAHFPVCPFALISHNVLPSNFALALAIYVAIQATIMARAREKFEGKRLCEIRAKGQK